MENRISWEYVAGFFDGEGSIGWSGANNSITKHPRAQMSQVRVYVLREIKDYLQKFGIHSTIYTSHKNKLNPKWTDCHNLVIFNKMSVVLFLGKILPFLRVKKIEAEDMLRFIKAFPPAPTKYVKAHRWPIIDKAIKEYMDGGGYVWTARRNGLSHEFFKKILKARQIPIRSKSEAIISHWKNKKSIFNAPPTPKP